MYHERVFLSILYKFKLGCTLKNFWGIPIWTLKRHPRVGVPKIYLRVLGGAPINIRSYNEI